MSMSGLHPASDWERVSEVPCAWGSSPFWHAREERLYWIDVGLKHLWRLHVPSGHAEHWDLPQTPGSIAPCRSGGLLVALRDGLYLSAAWRDIPQKIAVAPFDTQRIRFSDGKCDPWGRFWVGSHVDAGDKPDGALYCLHKRDKPQPELLRVMGGAVQSDGMAWSPDGRTLYWADAARHEVNTFAMHHPGQYPPQLGPGMPFNGFTAGKDGAERPGGMAMDQQGRLWMAVCEGARVLCLSPKGDILATYATPAQCPTMLCFGGHDLRTLYLTTARAQRSTVELEHYPASGAVFSLRVNTPGLPVAFYED
jgi:sugar lactone lactonase YvrE